MIQIIRKRERITTTYRVRRFHFERDPDAGYAFDVDESGDPTGVDSDSRRANWAMCLAGIDPRTNERIIDDGIHVFEQAYMQPAVGRCHCGQEISLSRFTNTCECGKDYNSSGQELAPRSQWGEETGESVSDILAIDNRSPKDNLDDDDY